MLDLDDERWVDLCAGYRRPIDIRPFLSRITKAGDDDNAWSALWQELYHQGDVGEGSYAIVPHLVRLYRERGVLNWNVYALVATIELARGRGNNPEVPDWLRKGYEAAIADLKDLGLRQLPDAREPTTVRAILALLATACGVRAHGRILLELDEVEAADVVNQMF